ncbi:MAG: phosphate ABC transporter permease subunit PstC [Alphaproteobacteria bacterium]
MSPVYLIGVLLILTAFGYFFGRARAAGAASGKARALHSLPGYYGIYVALWCGIPGLAVLTAWLAFQPFIIEHMVLSGLGAEYRTLPPDKIGLVLNDIRNLAAGNIFGQNFAAGIEIAAARLNRLDAIGHYALFAVASALAIGGLLAAGRHIQPNFRARIRVERAIHILLVISSLIAIVTTVGIVLSLLFESVRFFDKVPILDFLFGLQWSPQTALRADQVASDGAFGVAPVLAGTLLITLIAMLVAVPVGLMSAIYMAEYAPGWLRDILKPALEILAGIPTVVYGFFAALTVAPLMRQAGATIGLDVASESALAAGLVMGIMIIPFVSSLSDDVINAVPQTLRDGAYALGATRSETIRNVVVPAALPGIVGGVLLAVSRAIGETMIVVMAAGLAANLTANPLEAVTTVTVQIVTLLVGDQEFDSAKTLAAFALGLTLFCLTLALNVIALRSVRKYREKYD